VISRHTLKALRQNLVVHLQKELLTVERTELSGKTLFRILFWKFMARSFAVTFNGLMVFPMFILATIIEFMIMIPLTIYVIIDANIILFWYVKEYINRSRKVENENLN
jgi:hypothetical protein